MTASPTVTNHKVPTPVTVSQLPEKPTVLPTTQPATSSIHSTPTSRPVLPTPPPKKPPLTSTLPLPADNTFTDPLEQSLASLEQDKNEGLGSPLSNIGSIPAIPNIPNINPTHHLPMINQMIPPNPLLHPSIHGTIDTNEITPVMSAISTANMLHSNNNGFGNMEQEMDMPMNNNGLSIMPMSISSIFDPLPTTQPIMNSIPNLPIKKGDKPLIHPKPIEELSNPIPNLPGNHNDKKMTPPEQKSSNFASAFKPKQEQNIKNASSWSSLAQANSPQNSNTGVSNRQMADSFQQFKKQAKEKADRQKALLEQQEMRRQQKEQAEKERLRAENERRREKEEEEALEKAR